MRRALAAAARAPHRTSPNPKVGCVIVREGMVVGQGVTRPPGQAHAESLALEAAGERARGATVYVTLEPCCHHGRTPPCTDALIAAGVRRVVAGAIDPNPMVAGRGLAQLREAGVEVEILEGAAGQACVAAVAPFRRFILDARPWVLLKAAVSLDGRIAASSGDSKWITGEAARRDGHRLRAWADAILVGAGTVRADNPRLTVRGVRGENPRRVVLNRELDLDPSAAVFGPGAIVFHEPGVPAPRRATFRSRGALVLEVESSPGPRGGLSLVAVLARLAEMGVVQLLVEGGGRVHGALVGAALADEACFYVAPRLLGEGRPVLALPGFTTVAGSPMLDPVTHRRLGDDVRIRGPIRYPGAACSPG